MKTTDFDEDVFIPFVSDDEDDEFASLQQVWHGDDEFLEELRKTNDE